MKAGIFYVFVLVFISLNASAQDFNKIVSDEKVEAGVLMGECNRDAFIIPMIKEWYDSTYKAYEVDKHSLEEVLDHLMNVEVLVVFGSWCHDSHRELPRFMKIWDEMELDDSKLRFVALNTKKQAEKFDVKGNDIKLVPTFIVKRDGLELGRIVEVPNESLEKDLQKILYK
jgi:thiol-disulfide isomerase/thioredoxin